MRFNKATLRGSELPRGPRRQFVERSEGGSTFPNDPKHDVTANDVRHGAWSHRDHAAEDNCRRRRVADDLREGGKAPEEELVLFVTRTLAHEI